MQRRFHSSYRAVTLTGARQWTEAGRRGEGKNYPARLDRVTPSRVAAVHSYHKGRCQPW